MWNVMAVHEIQQAVPRDTSPPRLRCQESGQVTTVERTDDGLHADSTDFRRLSCSIDGFNVTHFIDPQQVATAWTRRIARRIRRLN